MSPEYFHNHLTYGEADDYLGGMQRRHYHGYSQARMVAATVGQLFAKNYKAPVFPWEEAEKERRKAEGEKPPTEEELAEMLADAKRWEDELNGRGGREEGRGSKRTQEETRGLKRT